MNRDELRARVVQALGAIAPEADLASLDPRADLREALDLDSMDFLRFVVSLHEALGVDVAERDYPGVRTLDGCLDYLERRPR